MQLSLIVCAYNEEKYIKACLESIVAHSENSLSEIIVVNNASTDATKERAEEIPGVRVVTEPNKGLTYARKRGAQEAKGDILIYIDADSLLTEGWIKKVVNEFQKDPKLVCASGVYQYMDIDRITGFVTWIYWYLFCTWIAFFTGYMVVGGNFAVRKEVLSRIGGFNTDIAFYGEDTDLGKRLHAIGKVRLFSSIFVYTSSRRFKYQGVINTGATYIKNFFSIVFKGKPASTTYKDFR
jgi:glycosyltransferase involved in cell wall biosynthesis